MTRSMTIRSTTLAVLATMMALGDWACKENNNGTATGRVINRLTGKPIVGATVATWWQGTLAPTPIQTTTGIDGTFMLEDVIPGPHTVTVAKPGFAALDDRDAVVVKGAKTTVADLFLIEEPKAPGLYDISTGTYGRKFEPSKLSGQFGSSDTFIEKKFVVPMAPPVPKPVDLLLVTDRRVVAGPVTFGSTSWFHTPPMGGKTRCERNRAGPQIERLGQRFVRIRGNVITRGSRPVADFCVAMGHPGIAEAFLVTVTDPNAGDYGEGQKESQTQ